MKVLQAVKDFVSHNRRNVIIYGAVIIVTIVLAVPLLVWAGGSTPVGELIYAPATVKLREGMRTEYLVNETISPEDYSLELEDGTVIDGADCTVEADMTSAGLKNVQVSWQEGDTVHSGTFPVKVFGVRHISIEEYPSQYWIDANGSPVFTGSDQLVVWAELTGEPTEFEMPADHPDWTTTVVLEPEMYSVSCTATTEGSAFEVKCGNVSTGFALIDNGQGGIMSLPMQSMSHYVSFDNVSGGAETLTLYIEQAERNTEDGDAEGSRARGTYVYTAADGTVTTYRFEYYLQGWSSNFLSAALNNWAVQDGVDDANWGGDMRVTVTVNYVSTVFRGARADWHFAVLDNRA